MKILEIIKMLAIPLGVGGLSAFLSKDAFNEFQKLNQPPLSPPAVVFPVAWTLLYILMGIGSYLVFYRPKTVTDTYEEDKRCAKVTYAIQLALNFLWTPVFFVARNYVLASFILAFLLGFIWRMISCFKRINPVAAYLQIPYLLWCIFAFYLNIGIIALN